MIIVGFVFIFGPSILDELAYKKIMKERDEYFEEQDKISSEQIVPSKQVKVINKTGLKLSITLSETEHTNTIIVKKLSGKSLR